jgi:hypothetical protein
MVNSKVSKSFKNSTELVIKLGLRGYTGNKGSICIRFDYNDTSICIINCHLAPHKSKFKARNDHIKSILKQTVFNVNSQSVKIYEHDHIFWTGDFNYRIQGIELKNILDLIYSKDYTTLAKYDQLLNQMSEGKILFDFQEGPLDFPPTFKYKKYSNEYS